MPGTLGSNIIGTSTRYLDSNQKNSPLLLDEYGSLNNLLKTVLVKGFNEQIVESFLLDTETAIGEIHLALNHGFVLNQVVLVSGAKEENFNGYFRILSVETLKIKVKLEQEKFISSASTLTGLKIKVAPLGYEIVYEDSTKGTLCFKNNSITSPGILKSIDKLPGYGYQVGWAKYARVVIGQNIDSEGNFINNNKAPFWSSFPYCEDTGNEVIGEAGVHGFAKWDYAIYSLDSSTSDIKTPHGSYPTDWRIIGDDKTFYLMIRSMGKNRFSFNLLGFGNYIPENPAETTNICLQAKDGSTSTNSTSIVNFARTRNEFGVLDAYYGGFLFSNIYGRTGDLTSDITGYGRYKCLGNFLSDIGYDKPWESTDIKGVNPSTGSYCTSKLYIKDADNYLRGYHRGVKITYGLSLPEDITGNQEQLVLEVQTPYRTSVFKTMPLIFTLNDWES